MEYVNATNTGVNALNSISGDNMGIMLTIVVFFLVIGTVFLMLRNFRQLVVGAIVSGVLLGNYKFSRWIGTSTQAGNAQPLNWTLGIAGFIVVSVLIGKVLSRFKFMKNLEKKMFEEQKANRK